MIRNIEFFRIIRKDTLCLIYINFIKNKIYVFLKINLIGSFAIDKKSVIKFIDITSHELFDSLINRIKSCWFLLE